MPLRSVEAATRDDAIAAAREQFGPSARVVGVRRVRSGGVLGFFATERYVAEVAEVAPDLTRRPTVPSTARQDDAPADFSSPLASAAPARARTAAPARNGAAAWAAEAARATDPAPTPVARTSTPSWQPAPEKPPADEERVSEFASLLAAKRSETEVSAYGPAAFPRASAPRPGPAAHPAPVLDADAVPAGARDANRRVIPADVPDAPSPFTAALARMVAGDREVREAVEEALVRPGGTRAGSDARPVRPEPIEESVVPSSPAPQEEEPVGDQVIAPSSTRTPRVDLPTWAAEPETVAPSVSPREEAIAEVLRDALAQGHSDEALAGILRKVLDGASPQSALAPVVVPAVAVPEASAAEPAPAVETTYHEAPAFEAHDVEPAVEPVFEPAALETAYDLPAHEAPVSGATMFEVPVFEPRPPVDPFAPVAPAPAWVLSPATSMWGPPTMSATLWGEAATPVVPHMSTYTPIWDEVSAPANRSAAVEPSLFEEPTVGADPAEAEDAVAEDTVSEDTVSEDTVVEESAVEDAVSDELVPLLARTASDPAPSMSFESTTIMPPLSLLPPLPGSRGRGRPPVPPAPSRRSSASSSVAPGAPVVEPESQTGTAPAPPDEVQLPVDEVASALATVTRLPVAPQNTVAEVLDLPERLFAPATPVAEVETPVDQPVATGSVADRLVELGVPRSLLGAAFAEDVADRGTYAALTRALTARLPHAPELPNGPGEVLFLVGPGIETLRTAQTLAASLRLDPDRVQWATRGDLAGLAPESSRVTTVAAAMNRRDDAAVAGTVTIVAVDAPMRADAYWTTQMMGIFDPVAVWAVVEATRKPEDLEPWLARLPRVDALVVQDADLSVDPAAVLRHAHAPVALIDGARATPHRWASLLCERLENPQT